MYILKYLLWPISQIYGLIVQIRNFLFDTHIKKSFAFDLLVIGVGNLSVGGSGKTPLTIWLLGFLEEQNMLPAMLSRGYGRRTSGFGVLGSDSTSQSCGDEPLMVYRHFGGRIPICVCEKRLTGLPLMLAQNPNIEAFVLDDVFQHRAIRPKINLLLSEWNKPFWEDMLLPSGRLREPITGAKRATALIITKTPEHIEPKQLNQFKTNAAQYLNPGTPIFFSYLQAQNPKSIFENANNGAFDRQIPTILFSGIARPFYFAAQAKDFADQIIHHHIFKDHHPYTIADIETIITNTTNSENPSDFQILCTEKDMVKLLENQIIDRLKPFKVFYLPVLHQFYEHQHTHTFVDFLKKELGK